MKSALSVSSASSEFSAPSTAMKPTSPRTKYVIGPDAMPSFDVVSSKPK